MHAIVAMARLDCIGIIYFAALAVWLAIGSQRATGLWRVYLVVIGALIMFQYCSALGLPPVLEIKLPWASLSETVLAVIGIAVEPSKVVILPGTSLVIPH